MQKKYARIIDFLYGPWFRLIGFFYRNYSANRERLARFKANQGVARVLRLLTVLFFIAWILVWFFASEADRSRLTDEVKQTIGGFGSGKTPPLVDQPAVD